MQRYIEITLIGNPDYMMYKLWSKLYMQLHIALVSLQDQQQKTPIGISFPEYLFDEDRQIGFLGTKLRVFAHTQAQLEQLNLAKWFS